MRAYFSATNFGLTFGFIQPKIAGRLGSNDDDSLLDILLPIAAPFFHC